MNYAVQMMQILKRLVDELGKTILIVLHDINFAASYADEIVAMKAESSMRMAQQKSYSNKYFK